MNPQSIVARVSRSSFLEAGVKCDAKVTGTGLELTPTQFINKHSNI